MPDPLGGHDGRIGAEQVQRSGTDVDRPQAPGRGEEVHPPRPVQPRQRQALEDAVEPPLTSPPRLAREARELAPRALRPRAVGGEGLAPARRVVGAARSGRDTVQVGQRAGRPVGPRIPDRRKRSWSWIGERSAIVNASQRASSCAGDTDYLGVHAGRRDGDHVHCMRTSARAPLICARATRRAPHVVFAGYECLAAGTE